ncbi:MAG: minichromosome maintenance protein MCM, partial [Thermodesulfovibrionales bacterium]|nr:minichromosome maintenance protein MCM [Thermodesulfovibrionales bacterium]
EYFLERYYWEDIIELSIKYPEKRSLLITFTDIDVFDPTIADMLLEDPGSIIDATTQALRGISIPSGVTLDEAYVRVIKSHRSIKIKHIRYEHIGKFISIEGLVVKATEVRPRIVEAAFECPFCHHIFSVMQSGQQFKEPVECEQESGGCGRKVQRFITRADMSQFVNAQKIRLQESLEELRGGEIPQAIDVTLESDLTGIVTAGDRIIVNGILRATQKVSAYGKTPFYTISMEANSIEKREEEYEEIVITGEDEKEILKLKEDPLLYEKFIRSIAPSIYGCEEIKEALVLQLFGGTQKKLPDGMTVRGDIHMLLVGDPGIAKSQLLAYQARIAPRGLFTSGKSSTAAGLTATVVKDEFGEGRWTLEAGALVLADKGIAAVDE